MTQTTYDCSRNDCQQTDTADIVGRFYTFSHLLVSYRTYMSLFKSHVVHSLRFPRKLVNYRGSTFHTFYPHALHRLPILHSTCH